MLLTDRMETDVPITHQILAQYEVAMAQTRAVIASFDHSSQLQDMPVDAVHEFLRQIQGIVTWLQAEEGVLAALGPVGMTGHCLKKVWPSSKIWNDA